MNAQALECFSQELKALAQKKSHSICEYCGCNHRVRLIADGPNYSVGAEANACHQYIRDIHSEIRAIKNRLGLPIEHLL